MVNTPFLDVEIHIFPCTESGYPAHIRLSDGQDFAGELAADLAGWKPTGNPTADGQHLFAALFADPKQRRAWDIACGQSPQRRIRLWLDADAPELHALPWELLYDGQTFLAANAATPFSRYLPSDAPWGGLVAERPIRILAVIANPVDLAQHNLAPLDVAAERALLTDALGDLAPTHFRLEILEAPVTLERLERALASSPHVLHFVGHGAFGKRSQEAVLYLQDVEGNAQIVTDAQLCDMLRRQAQFPSLIFLAACQSAERSTVDAFAGIAPRLVQAGVPAVVAMQDKVAMTATRKLMPVFYEELARHGEVDRALNAARSLLLTGQSPDAATPVLLMRLADGKLWEPLWAKTNPYRGLAAFTEADAAFFFGRESLITELSDKVRRQRFIAVVGPSGSGKSSVVQAGLLPRLPKDWQVIKLRPSSDPYANSEWQKANGEWRIANGESPVDPLIPRAASGQVHRSVLFIDQFEELFALCPPDVQTCFLDDLQALIASPAPITVILTLRADFFGYLQNPPLGKHLEHALVNVLPMEPADLRAAIERPAQAVGLRFEAGLVKTIVEDARQARHTLPLLQAALTQLWEQQTQGTLTYDAYVTSGRVTGAIGLWAEDAYNGLTTEEQRLARRIFTRLVHYSEGEAVDTRQRRTLPELLAQPDEHDALHRLLQKLADARLLTTDEAQGVEFVEIIHDALLKEWPRLEQWLTERREFYLWRQRLETYLGAWEAQGRDNSALLRGALLAEAERWTLAQPEELNPKEQEYIQQSLALWQREEEARAAQQQRELEQAWALAQSETRRVRNLRIGLSVAVLFLLVALGAAWIAMQQTNLAEQRLGEARDAESTAVAEAYSRATAQAETEIQRSEAENAQATAEARRIEAEDAKATAEVERDRAERETQVALAQQLAARSQIVEDPIHSTLLAIESWQRQPSLEVEYALRRGLTVLPRSAKVIKLTGHVAQVLFSPDGSLLAANSDNTLYLWKVSTGRVSVQIQCEKTIRDLVFTSDGYRLATLCGQGVVIFDATTCAEIARIFSEDGTSLGSSLIFSPDDNLIAVDAYRDGKEEILIWEVNTGHLLAHLSHEDYITTFTFSPDGRWFASGSNDGTARLWRVGSWSEVARIRHGHEDTILDDVDAIVFSPDSRWLLTGSNDGRARIWDIDAGHQVLQVEHLGGVGAVAFSPDGRWFATAGGAGGDNTARIWESLTGRQIAEMRHKASVLEIAFSPDGKFLATASIDRTARLWRLPEAQEIARVMHGNWVTNLAFSPDGEWIATCGRDEILQLWQTNAGQELFSIENAAPLSAVSYSPDGRLIAAAGQDFVIRIWDLNTRLEIANIPHGTEIKDLVFSMDSNLLAASSKDEANVWDARTGQALVKVAHTDLFRAVFSPDHSLLATVDSDTVRVWSTHTGKQVAEFKYDNVIVALTFTADNHQLVLVDWYTIYLFDISSNQEVRRITNGDWIFAAAFRPDLQQLVTGNVDGGLRIWKLLDLQEERQMDQGEWIYTIVYDSSGQRIAVRTVSALVSVWDMMSYNEISRVPQVGVIHLIFSPDSRWLAAIIGGHEISIWKTGNGEEVTRISQNIDMFALHFDVGGQHLMSADDNKVYIWAMQANDLIDEACMRLPRNLTHAEWTQYLGDEPYRATCPNLPIPEEAQP